MLDAGASGAIVPQVASPEQAEQAAREFIARLARRDEWPLIGNRFVRSERIRSIEIRERQRFTGSSRRALWGGVDDSAG
jgi:2-keto-3-deoxy-L-rhamnonate aldolase RhmA